MSKLSAKNMEELKNNSSLDCDYTDTKTVVHETADKSEEMVIIDDVYTKCIKGERFKIVSFFRDNGGGARYSTLVYFDAQIPEIGESMFYSQLQGLKVSRAKIEELEKK